MSAANSSHAVRPVQLVRAAVVVSVAGWYNATFEGAREGRGLSQVPQPLLRGICGVAWPHSLATAPLCQLVQTPEPISGAH